MLCKLDGHEFSNHTVTVMFKLLSSFVSLPTDFVHREEQRCPPCIAGVPDTGQLQQDAESHVWRDPGLLRKTQLHQRRQQVPLPAANPNGETKEHCKSCSFTLFVENQFFSNFVVGSMQGIKYSSSKFR